MRLLDVTLQARDPEALAAWYRETLGLPAGDARNGVVAGGSALRFEAALAGVEPRYHVAFNVPENQLAEAVAWLRPRAPLVASDEGTIVEYPAWDAHAVYFVDPAGNVLELIARHALANASSRPFGGASLLEISEVGLPSPHVPRLAADLKAALGVPEYRPAKERFAPLGDERGLLILVPQGRPWFPTLAEATPFPVRIAHEGPSHRVPGLPYRFETA